MVIECIGLPGGGKSYLMERLARELERGGYHCVNVSARSMTDPAFKAAKKLMHAVIWMDDDARALRDDMERVLSEEGPFQSRFGLYGDARWTQEAAAILTALYPRMMRSETVYLFDEGLIHTLVKFCADGLLKEETLEKLCALTERRLPAKGRIVVYNRISVEDCLRSIGERDRHICAFDELEGESLEEILRAYQTYSEDCAGRYGAVTVERRAPIEDRIDAVMRAVREKAMPKTDKRSATQSLEDKFRRAGGFATLRQYADSHVLLFAGAEAAMQGLSQKSLEIVRLGVNNKVLARLRRSYRPFINSFVEQRSRRPAKERRNSGRIWILWMDGMENAPDVVQMCCRSVERNLKDREIVLLSEDNFRDYIQLPDFIEEKYRKGIISKTHMSDLIRLSLLIRYGGTWVDSTVFCTGGDIPPYMLGSDLFLFQDLKPGADGHSQRISNWFMTASSHSPILELTRALLFQYWKENDRIIDYYLFHDFFELAIETYPEEWAKVIPFSNAPPHILLLRLFEQADPEVFDAVRAMTPFHKLTYKFEEGQKELAGTYYQMLREVSQE